MKFRNFAWILSGLVVFTACTKNNGGSQSNDGELRDSTLAISRDIYLWNDQIPSNFNARAYRGPVEIMQALRQYSIEPGFSEPVDHYSFAMDQDEWDDVSNGIISDFGLNAFFLTDTDLRVRAVEEASPAGIAGVRRGWKFVRVAGNNNINTDNSEFLAENIYESETTSFTFEKPDGSTVDVTLNAATYQEHPVVLDSIYPVGGKKAGYLVFNSFLGDTNQVLSELTGIFSRFVAEGVTDVIVDLRYNGGGYVSLSEALANFLIKTSSNGSIMMTQQYNENYSDLNDVMVFRKRGSLDISNIYFIVTENTASASELLINNLKPFMNVKIVGPEATFGKPVGFFPIPVGDWYVFPVSFRSTNGVGEGNYFDGIPVDKQVDDGLDKDWGDVNESSLKSVLTHIGTGGFGFVEGPSGLNSTLETKKKEVNRKLNHNFKGAVK